MKKEISYYKTSEGKQFAKIRFTGEKSGIIAICDTQTFPYVYYYPHIQIYDRWLLIEEYERMAPGCPCLTCQNFPGGRCSMIDKSVCHTLEDWSRQMERVKHPKQLTLNL